MRVLTSPLGATTTLGQSISAGQRYWVYDAFSDDKAAGSVNGTNSTGGQLRTVNDTGNVLSITGGKASLAAGSADGNPGLWYPSTTRIVGRLLIIEFNATILASKIVEMGLDTNQAGSCGGYGIRTNGTTDFRAVDGGFAFVVGGGLSASSSYKLVVSIHSTGADIFLQGGAYTYPTLVWPAQTGSGANLFPQFNGNNATTLFDYIKGPTSLTYCAQPLASDSFASAFGTTDGLGHVDAASTVAAGGSGVTWTQQVGTWQTSGGVANASALSGGKAIATVPLSTADFFAIVDLTRPSAGSCGIVARYTDSSNYLICYTDGTNLKLDQVVSGSTTNLISAAVTYGAGKKAILMLDGTSARIWYSTGPSVHVGTSSSINAALTAANAGLYTTDTGNTFDNFHVKARGTANEHGAVSSFFLTNAGSAYLFAVGDSKTDSDDWVGLLIASLTNKTGSNWYEIGPRFGVPGYTTAQMKTYIDNNLASVTGTANNITINLGANDMTSMPTQSAFKASLTSIIDSLRAKWSGCKIYVARPWRQGHDTDANNLATWIGEVIATYGSNVYAGIDERVVVKGSDDGASETIDGIHYSQAEEPVIAAAWTTSMGY